MNEESVMSKMGGEKKLFPGQITPVGKLSLHDEN